MMGLVPQTALILIGILVHANGLCEIAFVIVDIIYVLYGRNRD